MHKNRTWCSLALAAFVFTGLAFAAPSNQVISAVSIDGGGCTADYSICVGFSASISETTNGTRSGTVSGWWYDIYNSEFLIVNCSSVPKDVLVSVSPGNGNSSLTATIDPSGPDCQGSRTPGAPTVLTLNLSGTSGGGDHSSITGVETDYYGGVRYQSDYQDDCFAETYGGTMTPSVDTSLQGLACARHSVVR